nr:UNC93-like protein [Maniola hyperantus]
MTIDTKDIDLKSKEIKELDLKTKEMKEIDLKTKEVKEIELKAKEMKEVDLKAKQTKEIDLKQKEIKDIDYKPKETWRIMKNVVIISIAFMVQFTAYSGAANLQSSINAEAGLGTASLAAVYAGLIFSNIFLPVVVIKWLGTKWAMSVSFITYMPYIAAQLYPRFWTLIPAGLFVGLGGGPLWCSKCTYLSIVSEVQSKITNISAEALLVRFFGVFFMIFQLNQVWGNLISSLVISSGDNLAAVTAVNASMIPKLCGANFLPSADAGEALQPQPPEKIQMIAGIYLACMAGAALIVAVGVDSMKRYKTSRGETGSGLSGVALLVVTLKLLIEPNPLMLVIINIFVGMQQAFFGADFTASFVSCAIGTGTVGFVMMTFGMADAIGCVVFGYLAKVTGRIPLIIVATIAHFLLFMLILVWKPQHDQSHIMFIIAIFWGLCDSIWLVQINAYYGILFPGREEAAFSNFRLWESVGYIIAYIISPYFRTSAKTYILLGTMIVGVFFYFIVEYRDRKSKKFLEISPMDKYVGGLDNSAYNHGE